MEYPKGLRYSREHEWVMVEGGDTGVIGISDFAQSELGDVVYVEAPELGEKISKDDPFGAVESVKAVSDLYAPVSGTVVEVNDALPETPELINEDPYGEGWIIKVSSVGCRRAGRSHERGGVRGILRGPAGRRLKRYIVRTNRTGH